MSAASEKIAGLGACGDHTAFCSELDAVLALLSDGSDTLRAIRDTEIYHHVAYGSAVPGEAIPGSFLPGSSGEAPNLFNVPEFNEGLLDDGS